MRQPVRPRARASGAATTYTGYGTGTPSGLVYAADTDPYTLATAFTVTTSGLSLTKVRFWLDSNTGAVSSANVLSAGDLGVRVYGENDVGAGASGSALATGTVSSLTMDAWNEHTLASPLSLTVGFVYYAALYLPAGRYSARAAEFDTPITVGPITFPTNSAAQGSAGTVRNGAFNAGADAAPATSFNATWYGIDVAVA